MVIPGSSLSSRRLSLVLAAALAAVGASPSGEADLYQVLLLPGRGEVDVRFTPAGGGEAVSRIFRPADGNRSLRVEPGNSYLFPESLWDRFAGSRTGPFRIEVTTRDGEAVHASGSPAGVRPAPEEGFAVSLFQGTSAQRGDGLFVLAATATPAGAFPPPPPWVGHFMSDVISHLEARFGPLPGPVPRIAVLDFPAPMAKSYPGTIVLDRTLAQRDGPPPAGRVAILAHEVAHQWWPGAVPVQGPGAGTLQEGLAEYGACRALGGILGPAAEAARWAALRDEYVLASETLADAGAGLLHPDGGLAYGRALRYARSAWVVRMLEERAGAEPFRTALAEAAAAGGPLTWDGLLSALAAGSSQDLSVFRATWIDSAGHPDPRIIESAAGEPPLLENRGRGAGEFPVVLACAGEQRDIRHVSVPPGGSLSWHAPVLAGCALSIDPAGAFLLGPRGPVAPAGLTLGRAWGYPVVRAVAEGTAAERSGLRPGDLLVQAAGRPLSEEDVAMVLGLLTGGEEVRLRVRRGADELEVIYRALAR